MNDLAMLVFDALANDPESSSECRALVGLLEDKRGPDDSEHDITEKAGKMIRGWIGELPGLQHDGIHDTLWGLFMNEVSWYEVGRLWRERVREDG